MEMGKKGKIAKDIGKLGILGLPLAASEMVLGCSLPSDRRGETRRNKYMHISGPRETGSSRTKVWRGHDIVGWPAIFQKNLKLRRQVKYRDRNPRVLQIACLSV